MQLISPWAQSTMKALDAMMGEYCECFHSKCASMVSNPLVDIMMWCNMLQECHFAIGQTLSWYKGGTGTIHNRDMSVKHWQEV